MARGPASPRPAIPATRHQPSYLSGGPRFARDCLQPDRAAHPVEPGGPAGAEPAVEIPECGLAAAVAERLGTGRQRRRQSAQTSASPSRGGDRRVAQEARRRQEPALELRQRARSSAKRGIDRRAHDLDRGVARRETSARAPPAPCATSMPRPSAARRPAARMARTHGVSPARVHHVERHRRARRRRRLSGSGSSRHEAERRGVDHARVHVGRRRDGRPRARAPSRSNAPAPLGRRGSATATAAPRSRAATTAARAPPPVPTMSQGPGGGSSVVEGREHACDVGVVADRCAVLAPERVAGADRSASSAADDRPTRAAASLCGTVTLPPPPARRRAWSRPGTSAGAQRRAT